MIQLDATSLNAQTALHRVPRRGNGGCMGVIQRGICARPCAIEGLPVPSMLLPLCHLAYHKVLRKTDAAEAVG